MYRLKSDHLVVLNQSPVGVIRPSWLFLGFVFLMMIIITACSSASTEVPPTPTVVPPTPGPISDEALMAAVKSDDVAEVKRLLEGGADPNYEQDSTRLMFVAVSRGNLDILKLLVEHGGYVYKDDLPNILRFVNVGYPATDSESQFFDYLLEQVIAQGGDVDQVDSRATALWWAASKDQYGLMQLLVGGGADINHLDEYDATALIYAAFRGRLEAVRRIVELGADVNIQGHHGETAIHVAASHDEVEVVQFLIDAGARLDIETDSGDTPLDYASRNNEALMTILQEASSE